jgi:[ribosomal protein S5]-alanine N-acetyltransferase
VGRPHREGLSLRSGVARFWVRSRFLNELHERKADDSACHDSCASTSHDKQSRGSSLTSDQLTKQMKAPERFETQRLVLRKPGRQDADAIFARYAADPEVTRLLGWPRHTSPEATRSFLEFSDAEWGKWPAGPYLLESRSDGGLLGSAGLAFETPRRAAAGYALAKDAWGKGYATEAMRALINIARGVGVVRLYALCHPDNPASWQVLKKCGFSREGLLQAHSEFPNLGAGGPCDVLCYGLVL